MSQREYEVIIKSLQKGLSINQIKTIFEQQNHITNMYMALDIITSNETFKRIDRIKSPDSQIEVITYKHPNDILLPHELNPNGVKKNICYC